MRQYLLCTFAFLTLSEAKAEMSFDDCKKVHQGEVNGFMAATSNGSIPMSRDGDYWRITSSNSNVKVDVDTAFNISMIDYQKVVKHADGSEETAASHLDDRDAFIQRILAQQNGTFACSGKATGVQGLDEGINVAEQECEFKFLGEKNVKLNGCSVSVIEFNLDVRTTKTTASINGKKREIVQKDPFLARYDVQFIKELNFAKRIKRDFGTVRSADRLQKSVDFDIISITDLK